MKENCITKMYLSKRNFHFFTLSTAAKQLSQFFAKKIAFSQII